MCMNSKKNRHESLNSCIAKIKEYGIPASVQSICECYHVSRDAFYKQVKRDVKRKSVADKVLALVQKERKEQPRIGSRKLHFTLKEQFKSDEIKVGRDRLFDILRENKMLIKRKKAYTKTTNSFHRFYKYNNIIKDLEITKPNQVWVSDITYIRTQTGFCYLALITDLYSRKIVGYDLATRWGWRAAYGPSNEPCGRVAQLPTQSTILTEDFNIAVINM